MMPVITEKGKYFSGLTNHEYGIKNYLDKWNLRDRYREIITTYTGKIAPNDVLCDEIQQNFGAFVQWVRKRYLSSQFEAKEAIVNY